MDNYIYDLWFKLKECFSPSKAFTLYKHFGSAQNIYKASVKDYMILNLKPAQIAALDDKNLDSAKAEAELANKFGIGFVRFGDDYYPELLEHIDAPPILLYAKGDLSVLKRKAKFCVVGARRASSYGLSAAMGISSSLAECGFTVVSGCAEGIDSASHKGALHGKGKTIGIMACGLDLNYPAQSHDLKEEIVRNGILLSEFPFGTPPLPVNFRIRNRILSGMSFGVAVIEAGVRSGALMTARYAADQGRDVFALPGNVSSHTSKGTNLLIKNEGASLLTSAEDILSEYIYRYPECFIKEEFEEVKTYSVETEKTETKKALPKEIFDSSLTEDERNILSIIGKTPVHIDQICRQSGLEPSKVNSCLTLLQIKGKIRDTGGRLYIR